MADSKDDDDAPRRPHNRRSRSTENGHRDGEVGRGRPPKEHQFKPGGKPGPGRPKGMRNKSWLEKLLNERVPVGEDRLGRPIYKTWSEINVRQILSRVSEKDLAAMRLVMEFEYKHAELERRYGPKPASREELLKEAEEQAEREAHAARVLASYIGFLELMAQLQQYGLAEFYDGVPRLTPDATKLLATLPSMGEGPPEGDDP